MLNNFKSISIKGGFFDSDTTLDLFPKNDTRLTFVFGRNGSGKTSVSNAINCIKNGELSNYESLKINDYSSNIIVLSEEEKKKIYVFNENFIDKNIKFADENGMNTIVMFGEQIELEEELKKNEKIFIELRQKNDNYKTLKSKYDDATNTLSPLFYKNEILDLLKNDYSWASREQKIKNLSRKSSVNDIVYESIISLDYKKDISMEKEELDKNIELLSNINSESIKFPILDFNYTIVDNYLINLKKLLSKKIEKPELTEREKKIYSVVEKGNQNSIISAKEHFAHNNSSFCPYCFQEISGEYREKLLKEFSTILNEDVEKHISELDTMFISEIEKDISIYYKLNNDLCININNEIIETNKSIKYVNELVSDKKTNIYSYINFGNFIRI